MTPLQNIKKEYTNRTVTSDDLTKSILFKCQNTFQKLEENVAKNHAHYVLNFFGYSDRMIDNLLEKDDRDFFYMLEDMGLVTRQEEKVTLYDGREWRINYWNLNKESILSISEGELNFFDATLKSVSEEFKKTMVDLSKDILKGCNSEYMLRYIRSCTQEECDTNQTANENYKNFRDAIKKLKDLNVVKERRDNYNGDEVIFKLTENYFNFIDVFVSDFISNPPENFLENSKNIESLQNILSKNNLEISKDSLEHAIQTGTLSLTYISPQERSKQKILKEKTKDSISKPRKRMQYPKNPEELRAFLEQKIDGRTFSELKRDGDLTLYCKARESGNRDLIKEIRDLTIYPKDPEILRDYLAEHIDGRTQFELLKNGDHGLYKKTIKSGNSDLFRKGTRDYPDDSNELREYLNKEIAGRSRRQLVEDGDLGLYCKALKSENKDLIPLELTSYPDDPEELRELLKKEINGRTCTQLINDGCKRLYDKALKSGNKDLVARSYSKKSDVEQDITTDFERVSRRIRYPKNPEELRVFLERKINNRTYSQLANGGDIRLYHKAIKTGNKDLINKLTNLNKEKTYSIPKRLRLVHVAAYVKMNGGDLEDPDVIEDIITAYSSMCLNENNAILRAMSAFNKINYSNLENLASKGDAGLVDWMILQAPENNFPELETLTLEPEISEKG